MMIPQRTQAGAGALGILLLGGGLAACEFDVTNPGPAEDESLDEALAHQPLVTGTARMFAEALNTMAYTTAAISRELFPAGSTSSFGITLKQQRGMLAYDDEHVSWTDHQRARAMAEEGFERFQRVVGDSEVMSYGPAAEISLWGGFAARLLGENFCEASFDGGGIEPRTAFLERAEQLLSRAIEIGEQADLGDVVTAARGGRASVRANLGDWSGAMSDADQVPLDFVFQAEYNTLDQDQYNRIHFASANAPYRAHSTWNTVIEDYYLETGDPRTPWTSDPDVPHGDASVGGVGQVPWYNQLKYPERESNINVTSGREMALLRAEHELRTGDWQIALELINTLRERLVSDHDGEPISLWTASNEDEVWTALKRERYIELWLEGRRMNDLRRWTEEGVPGEFSPLEIPSADSFLDENRSLCMPIPENERETNPNIPIVP